MLFVIILGTIGVLYEQEQVYIAKYYFSKHLHNIPFADNF